MATLWGLNPEGGLSGHQTSDIRLSGIEVKIVTCLRESKKRRRAAGRGGPFPRGLENFEGYN